jgi:hypothetical protein
VNSSEPETNPNPATASSGSTGSNANGGSAAAATGEATAPGSNGGSSTMTGGNATAGTRNLGAVNSNDNSSSSNKAASAGDTSPAGSNSAADQPGLTPTEARQFIGQDVVNTDGQSLGTLQDIITGEDGKPEAVLRYGGFLGLFQSRAAIPWSEARPQVKGNHLVFPLTAQQIDQAPRYASE